MKYVMLIFPGTELQYIKAVSITKAFISVDRLWVGRSKK
jgi:hypothetical protein